LVLGLALLVEMVLAVDRGPAVDRGKEQARLLLLYYISKLKNEFILNFYAYFFEFFFVKKLVPITTIANIPVITPMRIIIFKKKAKQNCIL